MKKALSALVLGMALSAGCVAQAGSIPSYMVPLKTYAVRYMDCYLTPGGEPKGYIDAGDYVIVEKIENGWAYGSYPVGSKRISRWFKADDLVNNVAFSNQDRTSPQQTTNTYKTAGYNSVFGSFNNYEPIVVVSDSGEFRQVIYKLSNGGYKMAWVPYWDCWLNGQAGRNEKEERKVNNNTVNKNPIIQPVKREEKKTEQTTTSTTEKSSIKYTSDTFGNASLSGRRIGYVTAGSDIEILADAGSSYYIRYWTDSGQARERYVKKDAVARAGTSQEQPSSSTTEKGTIRYTANTYGNASLSGKRLGYVTAGSDIEILAYAGDAYYIRYWTDSGQARERYVNKGAVRKAGEKEEPVNNNDAVAEIEEKLNTLAQKWNGRSWEPYGKGNGRNSRWPNGEKAFGGQCLGFANYIFQEIHGSKCGDGYGTIKYKLSRLKSNVYQVNSSSWLDANKAKEMLLNAPVGSFLQLKRRSSGSQHSAILLARNQNQVTILDANGDYPSNNIIRIRYFSYADFAKKNTAMSIYNKR